MNIKDYKKKMRGKGDINMSLYEINKNLMSQLPDYAHEQITELEGKQNCWRGSNWFII